MRPTGSGCGFGSLFAEERVGRPGPARKDALAAAEADRANAHVHLLDAAYAALVAGEARAADRLLAAECEAAAPPSNETTAERLRPHGRGRGQSTGGWYPGDLTAEIMTYDMPTFPGKRQGDPETCLVEAVAESAHFLRVSRTRIEQLRRQPDDALAAVDQWRTSGRRLETELERFEGSVRSLFLSLAHADLLRRAGNGEDAGAALDQVRERYRQAGPSGVAGWACTFLVEGDWYATPGSSPEALGFDLANWGSPSPRASQRDLARAASAYDRAAELLAGVDEPRALGALAVRRGALAWLSGDHAGHRERSAEAADAFGAAGDAAALRLARAQALLADVALGRVAATRRDAGTGLRPGAAGPDRGPSALGSGRRERRLDDRARAALPAGGRVLGCGGDYERAAVAYELAIPLVPASGAESPERVVLALAALDRDNGFDVRALTRSRSAVAALRDVENALEQPLEWARCIVCLQDLILGQVGATSTAGGMSVAALDWATEGLRQLLALPGVPPAGPEPPEPADIAGQIATYAHMARPLSGGPTPKPPSSAASWPRGSGPPRRPTGGTRRLSRGRPLCPGSPPPGR